MSQIFLYFFLISTTHAQILQQGLVGISGNYTHDTGTVGAVGNRVTADRLYQQALADEAAAWSTFPPNVGLLSKSLEEAKQGIKADDQSHHLAQSSLGGVQSGGNSGQLDLQKFNSLGVSDLKDLVNSSSSYYPQVASKLSSYGLNFSEDKKFMITPIGTFPVDSDSSVMEQAIKQFAGKVGVDTSSVASGLRAADLEAERIGKQAMNDVKAMSERDVASQKTQSDDTLDSSNEHGIEQGQLDGSVDNLKATNQLLTAGDEGRNSDNLDRNGIDWDLKQKELDKHRAKMMMDLGHTLIGKSDQNIFEMIHARYESLKSRHMFIEETATDSQRPMRAVPKQLQRK